MLFNNIEKSRPLNINKQKFQTLDSQLTSSLFSKDTTKSSSSMVTQFKIKSDPKRLVSASRSLQSSDPQNSVIMLIGVGTAPQSPKLDKRVGSNKSKDNMSGANGSENNYGSNGSKHSLPFNKLYQAGSDESKTRNNKNQILKISKSIRQEKQFLIKQKVVPLSQARSQNSLKNQDLLIYLQNTQYLQRLKLQSLEQQQIQQQQQNAQSLIKASGNRTAQDSTCNSPQNILEKRQMSPVTEKNPIIIQTGRLIQRTNSQTIKEEGLEKLELHASGSQIQHEFDQPQVELVNNHQPNQEYEQIKELQFGLSEIIPENENKNESNIQSFASNMVISQPRPMTHHIHIVQNDSDENKQQSPSKIIQNNDGILSQKSTSCNRQIIQTSSNHKKQRFLDRFENHGGLNMDHIHKSRQQALKLSKTAQISEPLTSVPKKSSKLSELMPHEEQVNDNKTESVGENSPTYANFNNTTNNNFNTKRCLNLKQNKFNRTKAMKQMMFDNAELLTYKYKQNDNKLKLRYNGSQTNISLKNKQNLNFGRRISEVNRHLSLNQDKYLQQRQIFLNDFPLIAKEKKSKYQIFKTSGVNQQESPNTKLTKNLDTNDLDDYNSDLKTHKPLLNYYSEDQLRKLQGQFKLKFDRLNERLVSEFELEEKTYSNKTTGKNQIVYSKNASSPQSIINIPHKHGSLLSEMNEINPNQQDYFNNLISSTYDEFFHNSNIKRFMESQLGPGKLEQINIKRMSKREHNVECLTSERLGNRSKSNKNFVELNKDVKLMMSLKNANRMRKALEEDMQLWTKS
ncbi:UNKNOWN [Stylonychia lemnae]|uniref:Uncharacterized protein n=1 Tax=Stylonychia lemnae TaxID=5949 RepID=A0A078AS67_STYLE|nr:UNKNOWN [Stylonychia lemnae]|eukprot:CDW84062.1 UNKNOWN [Stylonychia lemnae]